MLVMAPSAIGSLGVKRVVRDWEVFLGALALRGFLREFQPLGALVLRAFHVTASSWDPWQSELITSQRDLGSLGA